MRTLAIMLAITFVGCSSGASDTPAKSTKSSSATTSKSTRVAKEDPAPKATTAKAKQTKARSDAGGARSVKSPDPETAAARMNGAR